MWGKKTLLHKVDPSKTDGVTADNVTVPLVKILAPNSFTMHKEDFIASLTSEAELNFTPPGEKVPVIPLGGKQSCRIEDSNDSTLTPCS